MKSEYNPIFPMKHQCFTVLARVEFILEWPQCAGAGAPSRRDSEWELAFTKCRCHAKHITGAIYLCAHKPVLLLPSTDEETKAQKEVEIGFRLTQSDFPLMWSWCCIVSVSLWRIRVPGILGVKVEQGRLHVQEPCSGPELKDIQQDLPEIPGKCWLAWGW